VACFGSNFGTYDIACMDLESSSRLWLTGVIDSSIVTMFPASGMNSFSVLTNGKN